jgi:thiamine-phosphate pyrophosphorylase
VHPRLAALRLVAITDGGAVAEMAAALARRCPPGALLVQVRAKMLEGAALAELAHAVIAAVRPHRQLVLVNDRLDVALGVGADGVHLPERGVPIGEARKIADATGAIVGCSRHDAADAARAVLDGADLVHLGPIWATPSKAGMGAPLGSAALRAARQEIGETACLVAVGGIDAAHAEHARAAGAHAVAAIRAAWAGELLCN